MDRRWIHLMVVTTLILLFFQLILAGGFQYTDSNSGNYNTAVGYSSSSSIQLKVSKTVMLLGNKSVTGYSTQNLNGAYPGFVTYDQNNGMYYVAEVGSGTVSVVNAKSGSVTGKINVGSLPDWEVIVPAKNLLFVANARSYNVTIINTVTDKTVSSLNLGSQVGAVTYDSSNGYVYAVYGRFSIAKISTSNYSLVNHTTISTSVVYPDGAYYNPYNNYIYITTESGNSILVFNPSTGTVPYYIGSQGYASSIVFDQNRGTLYARTASGNIQELSASGNSVLQSFAFNGTGDQIALDSTTNILFVTTPSDHSIVALNASTGSLVQSIHIGYYIPSFLSYFEPLNELVYTDVFINSMIGINPDSMQFNSNTNLGIYPVKSCYDPSNGLVYITSDFNGNVSVVNPSKGTSRQTNGVGSISESATYVPPVNKVYITYGRFSVGEINPMNYSAKLALFYGGGQPSMPTAIAYDPSNGYVYIANTETYNLSILNPQTNKMVGSINLGSQVTALAYDSQNGNMYVAFGRFSVAQISSSDNQMINHIQFSSVDTYPNVLVYDPGNNLLYVGGQTSYVTALNPSLSGKEQNLSLGPGSALNCGIYDPLTKYVFVEDQSGKVFLLNGSNSITEKLQLGSYDLSMAVDNSTGQLVITNYSAGTAMIIDVSGGPSSGIGLFSSIYFWLAIVAVVVVVSGVALFISRNSKEGKKL